MVTCIDVHLQSGDVSVYWLWLLLDVSAVSVVIVAICDMPRQKFSLRERVCIHNTYTVCNFSNFVALCIDDSNTPVSCDKRFRDFWWLCSNLSPISCNVSSVRTWRRWFTFLFFTEPVSFYLLACLLIVLGLGSGRPGNFTRNLRRVSEHDILLFIQYVMWTYTRSHNENSCLGISQIAIITITTVTALTSSNNHNQ